MEAFPKDFLWGTATSSYQIEGSTRADGRGESIWERFCREPGRVLGGDDGERACEHYRLWRDDVALMASLGIQAYRFSVAWPRILPMGRGSVNAAGLAFYDRLVDALLEKNIVPFPTLYHWDLPQPLEDAGGWTVRATVDAFAEYAAVVVAKLGDRVRNWMTLNEIPIFIGHGYQLGLHAPGLKLSRRQVNQAYHHALLAHGQAVRAVRAGARKDARVGLVNNTWVPVPATESEADIRAAALAFPRLNAVIYEPLFRGAYAPWWLEEQGSDAPETAPGDLDIIASPCDFHGVNLYSGEFVEAAPGPSGYRQLPFPKGYPTLALPWLKPVPQIIYWACRHLREVYGVQRVLVAESGCACDDEMTAEGRVLDLDRLQWLRDHFRSARRAVAEGLGLEGYFVWSLLDNFEWAEGYAKRFGIVHVDFETQKRTPKASARWYAEVIRAGSVL